jgi:hypothetical protein
LAKRVGVPPLFLTYDPLCLLPFVQEVGIDHFDLRGFYVNGYDTFVGTGNPTRVMTLVKRGSFKKVTQSDRTDGRREIWLTGTRFDWTQV